MGNTTLRTGCIGLAAAGLLLLAGGSSRATVFDLAFDTPIVPTDFFSCCGINFFQIGENLTLSPYGAVALNDGDTARVTINFGGDAVTVANDPASSVEVAVSFLSAGQLANPGTGSTQIDLGFDFTLRFLGVAGDLSQPTIVLPGQRNLGGGFGPAVAADLTATAFSFQGIQMQFANIHDNNAAAGITDANRVLPRNFDVTSFRIQSRGPITQGAIVAVPEPPSDALFTAGLICFGWVSRKRRLPLATVPGSIPSARSA